ncbi:MAG: DUF3105 domain-containing protein [Actinomycetota bacterium]|nr:DUF3105 domain-containing protein [Actinomycetota bacterium]
MAGGQGEQEPDVSGQADEARRHRLRLLIAYITLGTLALIALGAVLVLSSGSDSTDVGDPHINLESGITNGIAPDTRVGIEPPELEEQNLQAAARAADCELRLRLPEEGDEHIPASAPEPRYKTNPPTSGDHVEEQQADGAYRETPPPVSVVHSLEHGRLAIQYRPDLPERAQLELIGLFNTMYGGILFFPNPNMPYLVAATTWTKLLACPRYQGAETLVALRAFGKATWGRFGGEPVIGLSPEAPTPSSP